MIVRICGIYIDLIARSAQNLTMTSIVTAERIAIPVQNGVVASAQEIKTPIENNRITTITDVIGETIEAFELSREDEQFLNDALIINFGTEKRSIGISPNDGLIIDYWEDI